MTKYQSELVIRIAEIKKQTGKLADFDQILETLSWKPSKHSAQFTIRAVIAKGFVKKTPLELRRGRTRVCYELTTAGSLALDPRLAEPGVLRPEVESLVSEPESSLRELDFSDPGVPELDKFVLEELENE
jgi:DNA-binding PadR family transcriptional regulator